MKTAVTKYTDILEALGLEDLQPEQQKEIMIKVNELVFKGALMRLVEEMDDETCRAFEALMDRDSSEVEIVSFLRKHNLDADSAVREAFSELSDDILSVIR